MRNIKIIILLVAVLSVVACTKGTYADELKAEKATIKSYISRNNIKVLGAMPKDSVFAENEFYKTEDALYFRLDKKGTGKDTVEIGNKIHIRYKKFDLSEHPDTISYWTTSEIAYPTSFFYGVTDDASCPAWHLAVGMMQRSGAEATIICPAILGFGSDQSPLTPYVYKLKIKFNKQS